MVASAYLRAEPLSFAGNLLRTCRNKHDVRVVFSAARKAVVCPSEPMAIAKIEESRHWNERFK
jgi:hypothetical protein